MVASSARTASAHPLPPPGAGDKPFALEMESRLGTFIKQAEQALIAEKTRVLRPFDLTVPQYATLMALYYVPGQSAAQLARTALVSPQTMATILANLEAKQLVTRTPSAIHNKVLVTQLTAAGETLVRDADAHARGVEIGLAAVFDPDERATLRDLLERSISALRASTEARPSGSTETRAAR